MKRHIFLLAAVLLPILAPAQSYDVVIQGGRVLDPETGLDDIRNVGISQGKIRKISTEAMEGKQVISVRGLIVAPGFIDLHQHGQDVESQHVKAMDGVTTALELEIGKPDVPPFCKRNGRAQQEIGDSDDSIHGGAHLVAHRSQKRALPFAGHLCRFLGAL